MDMNGTTSPFLSDHLSVLEQATCRMTEAAHLNNLAAPVSSLGAFLFPNLDVPWNPGFQFPLGGFSDLSVKIGSGFDTPSTTEASQESHLSPSTDSACHSSSGSVSSRRKQSEDKTKYKTELCKQFSQNRHCSYGSRCTFAHGTWELRTVNRHKKFKTQYCREYHGVQGSGYCPYGSRCHFLHEEDPSVAFLLKQGLATRDPCSQEVVLLPKGLELLTQAQESVPTTLAQLLQTISLPNFPPLSPEP